MNTYSKYCPKVFVAKCEEQYEKGETIEVTTKYGKINECIVYNLVMQKDGYFYYSIVRADGFDSRKRAELKADRKRTVAINAEIKAEKYFERSEKDADFLSLGEPIKVGHHSEKRHRKIIEEAQVNTRKFCEQLDRAQEYERAAQYWDNLSQKIDLSMPESLEYFAVELKKAKEYHEGLKSGKYPRSHSYSLTYAKKAVNDMQHNYNVAFMLWGDITGNPENNCL